MKNARPQQRVGRTDRNTEVRCTHQRDGPGSFCGESSEGREFGDALAHGLDDTPAARHGSPPIAKWQQMITQYGTW
jgi:hypothetical protein